MPELGPETLARFQSELQSYALRYPDGPLRMIDIGNADLLEMIRAYLLPHGGSLDQAAEMVRRGGLPLGALAVAARRPYATMLVELSCGVQYAITADGEMFAREVSAARQAISGEAVIEASALAMITLLPERWPVARSAFASVRLPRPALVDIDAARSDLARAPGFSFSLSYDAERDVLVRQETSLAAHQHLHRRITEIDQAARQILITDLSAVPGPPDPHQAWLAAIHLAAERHLPLWSDDVAVRSIAVTRGIPVFGTFALLSALTEAGLIPDTARQDTLVFARACLVDLPLAPGDLLDLACEDGWAPGPAMAVVSRAALWADFPAGLSAYLQVVDGMQINASAALPAWFHAACDGATLGTPSHSAAGRLRRLTEAVASRIEADAEIRRALDAIAKHVEKACEMRP